ATWRDVHDAGAFRLADQVPGNDAMKFPRRRGCRPALASGDLGDLRREAAGMILGRQFVERTFIFPADQRRPRKLADNLIPFLARLLLEDLFERLELGHALDPFLALELLL